MQVTELSYSSLSDYQMCSLRYYYRKVANIEPEFISAELAYGKGFHNAIEKFLKAKMENKTVSVDELMVTFSESFNDPKIRYNGDSREEMADQVFELIKLAMERPIKGKVVAVEMPFRIKVEEDFHIIGFIDMVTQDGDKRVISDWKTVKRRYSESDIATNLQLSTYSLFDAQADLEIIALLKQKKPAMEIFPTTRTDNQRQRTVKTFLAVKKSIEGNQFAPNEGWYCQGCAYFDRCHKDF